MARLDQELEELAKQFVCVRIIQMRGVDTSIFQFDYDLTWAGFFLNPDLTIYGRYGSRADRGDYLFTIPGLKAAMRGALELHKGYPKNRESLKDKKGKAYPWKTPETMPSIEVQFRNKDIPKNCIHCHHVWRGVRRSLQMEKKPLPDGLIWVYPMPEAIGMRIDPDDGRKVAEVTSGSAAAKAGVQFGDQIERANGQPIYSIADLQWVLHNSPDAGTVRLSVKRGSEEKELAVPLAAGWRRSLDFTWRASTGDLRLGMMLEPMTDADRQRAGLKAGGLKVKNAGPNGPGARAGFKTGDFLLAIDGKPVPATEMELIAMLRQKYPLGQKVKLTAIQGGKREEVSMDIP